MATEKILIVDDEINICELLRLYLEKEGYVTEVVNDGAKALDAFNSFNPDMVLLDIMLPGLDGWQICREIRKTSQTPIIMLTAKGEVFDKVLGLELGADDYVVKPFEPKEVIARIKAVLRRITPAVPSEDSSNKVVLRRYQPLKSEEPASDLKCVSYTDLVINLSNYSVIYKGEQVDMPPKELELIYHLASNPNRVYTRDQLLDEVWGFEYYGNSRTVDVHVKRLREKLEGVSDQWELRTIWGVGYKFDTKS